MKMLRFFPPLFMMLLLSPSISPAGVVAVLDTGTDYEHPDLSFNLWSNHAEMMKGNNTIDNDGNGRIDDFYGWNMSENNNEIFDSSHRRYVTPDVIRFYGIVAKAKSGTYTKADVQWYQEKVKDKQFVQDVEFAGSYAHGTHVAGIILQTCPAASLLTIKFLKADPKVMEERATSFFSTQLLDGKNRKLSSRRSKADELQQFKAFILQQTTMGAKDLGQAVRYIHKNNARVANGSFGIGYGKMQTVLGKIFVKTYGKTATDKQLNELVDYYMAHLLEKQGNILASAPQTLFVFAAGNDASDNDRFKDAPANVSSVNSISVAATFSTMKLAKFSNYGAKTVDVAAPGVNIESTSPGNTHIIMSGTSQAAPYVSGVAASLFDIDPTFSPVTVKKIIMQTVDKKSFLRGKVKSGGIVNKKRACAVAVVMRDKGFSLHDAVADSQRSIKASTSRQLSTGMMFDREKMSEEPPFEIPVMALPSIM